MLCVRKDSEKSPGEGLDGGGVVDGFGREHDGPGLFRFS